MKVASFNFGYEQTIGGSTGGRLRRVLDKYKPPDPEEIDAFLKGGAVRPHLVACVSVCVELLTLCARGVVELLTLCARGVV